MNTALMKEKTSQDFELLYELSMEVGQSLTLVKNCQHFLDVLMKRLHIQASYVWLQDEYTIAFC